MSMPFKRPEAAPAAPSFLCTECGRGLKNLDIALYKKMINRGAVRYMCIDCLAEYIGVTREELLVKVEQFKRQGCTLFL